MAKERKRKFIDCGSEMCESEDQAYSNKKHNVQNMIHSANKPENN
jgi:hypothetical protein